MTLSIVMITFNSADVLEEALESIEGLWDELLVGDGGSTDGTTGIVKKYGATLVMQRAETALGIRKQELVEKAKGPASTRGGSSTRGGDWILVLDADERVSSKLFQEIRRIIRGSSTALGTAVAAYRIPYQNYVFGRPVYFGGEKYAKVRLFRRGYARISPEPLHEEVILSQELPKARPSQKLRPGLEVEVIGELNGVIHHFSYRSPWQLFAKFTQYAWITAGVLMQKQKPGFQNAKPGFEVAIKKLFLYGPHMVWARYINEKGYKDGWRGLVLALAFGYMEGMTYWFLFIKLIFTRPGLPKS